MVMSYINSVRLNESTSLKLKKPISIKNPKRSQLHGMYEYRNDDYELYVTADSIVELHSTIKDDIVTNWQQFVDNEAPDEYMNEQSQYSMEIKKKLLENIEVERTDNDH